MTEDLSAIARRLDTLERNVSDHSSSLSAIVIEQSRIDRLVDDRTPSEDTMKWLTGLRDEEVETLKKIGEMGEEGRALLFQALDYTKTARRVGWFTKWAFLGVLGLLVTGNLAAEQLMKFWAFIQGASK